MRSLEIKLKRLVDEAKGLPDQDRHAAIQYLEYREYGLCLDTVVTQLHEHDITIDQGLYDLIVDCAKAMDLPPESYSFVAELVR